MFATSRLNDGSAPESSSIAVYPGETVESIIAQEPADVMPVTRCVVATWCCGSPGPEAYGPEIETPKHVGFGLAGHVSHASCHGSDGLNPDLPKSRN